MAKMLRVLALTTPREGYDQLPCVPDPHGADATPQRRRTVGMKHKEVEPGQWAWEPTGEVEEIAYHHDILKALRDGDLLPADAYTAETAGVAFEPSEAPTQRGDGQPRQSGAPSPLEATKNALRSLVGPAEAKTTPDVTGTKDGE